MTQFRGSFHVIKRFIKLPIRTRDCKRNRFNPGRKRLPFQGSTLIIATENIVRLSLRAMVKNVSDESLMMVLIATVEWQPTIRRLTRRVI
jgi:hypothetical protein